MNVPKFLLEDLKLFSGIVSDLFPTIKEEDTDYGILDKAIRKACEKNNLRDVDGEPLAPAGSSHLGILGRGTETGRPASEALRPAQVCGGLGSLSSSLWCRALPQALSPGHQVMAV